MILTGEWNLDPLDLLEEHLNSLTRRREWFHTESVLFREGIVEDHTGKKDQTIKMLEDEYKLLDDKVKKFEEAVSKLKGEF